MVTSEELLAGIGMLELGIKVLKRQIEEFTAAVSPLMDEIDGVQCPVCNFILTEANTYNTMGAKHQQYACPNCTFRGEIVGG